VAVPFGNSADPQVITTLDQTTGNQSSNIGKDFSTSGGGIFPTFGNGTDVYHVTGDSAGFKFVGGVLSALGIVTDYNMTQTPWAMLQNGTSYLLPGGYTGAAPNKKAGIYDTVSGWTAKADMGTNRANAGAATLPDGRVIVVGGTISVGPTTYTATCEIFNPTNNTWTATGSLRSDRNVPCLVTVEGYVVSIGGASSGAGDTQCDIFDHNTGQWVTAFPSPDA
jgi:hypothetical protein